MQRERIEQGKSTFDVRFSPGVLADPPVIDAVKDEADFTIVDGCGRTVPAVEPGACQARHALVSGFSGGGSNGIEAAHDATDVEWEDPGAGEMLFHRWDQDCLSAAAGGFDEVGPAECHAGFGERGFLKVAPEVDLGGPHAVGQHVLVGGTSDLVRPGQRARRQIVRTGRSPALDNCQDAGCPDVEIRGRAVQPWQAFFETLDAVGVTKC